MDYKAQFIKQCTVSNSKWYSLLIFFLIILFAISSYKISVIIVTSGYFQVWNSINKNLLKTPATPGLPEITFSETICCCHSPQILF